MKVGTDAILLGAYAPIAEHDTHLLDVGSGTGVIALMLAQRAPSAEVEGIELDAVAAAESRLSVQESPFATRVHIHTGDYRGFESSAPFDLIVSNPPFFTETHSAEGRERNAARHIGSLTPEHFFVQSRALLRPPYGRVVIICATSTFDLFRQAAEGAGLHLSHLLRIHPTLGAPTKRLIAVWHLTPSDTVSYADLTIEVQRHRYTQEYVELVRPFYLPEYLDARCP